MNESKKRMDGDERRKMMGPEKSGVGIDNQEEEGKERESDGMYWI